VAGAAAAGQSATLLIEADRQVPRRIHRAAVEEEFEDPRHPEVDDVLDDLGELVLGSGGRVVVVPAERMRSIKGAAAILRF